METNANYPPIFKNQLLEEELNKKGYVVFPLLTANEAETLKIELEKYKDFHPEIFSTTIWSENKSCREEINNLLKPMMYNKLQKFLLPFQILFCNLIVKKSAPNGELDIHRDWQLVDEDQFRTLNLWCALQDVNEENSCLRVIEGSHRFKKYPRGRNVYNPIQPFAKEMNSKYSIPVPMKAGECILFDTQLYHSSNSNTSANDRLAFSTVVTYPNIPVYHFLGNLNNDKLARRLTVSPDFFVRYHLREMDFAEPAEYILDATDECYTISEIQPEEFDSFMKAGALAS